jgi:twitching motility protein PilT
MHERLRRLMQDMRSHSATDLHLTVGSRPCYRIFSDLRPLEAPVLKAEDIQTMIYSCLSDRQIEALERERELDCSVGIGGEGRFRINVFFQRETPGVAIRRLPLEIPGFAELGLPEEEMQELADLNSGLILVTGPTGSGKSTTLAAAIDHVNRHHSKHIVCIEDPLEYLHHHRRSLVNQREVGTDTLSFAAALKHVLREDPDVVQIVEMRDLETIESTLKVAETGHLALSTLHTNSAAATVNRVINVFPPAQQEQVKLQLSFVLSAVISQRLLPRCTGDGLVLAYEIMIVNPAIRHLIREGEVDQIYSHVQMGSGAGMRTMNESLADLLRSGAISENQAFARSPDVKELDDLLAEGW